MIKIFIRVTIGLLMLCAGVNSFAQIKGKVVDATDQSPVVGATVKVSGTIKGSVIGIDGKFEVDAQPGDVLEVSSIGYDTQKQNASEGMIIGLNANATSLDEVVIAVGSRNAKRTLTDTPLPVDILSTKELNSTGQFTFDKALQYRIPSFNTVNTPVNDATSLLDPYEIRNMGPSRTLILINGKRKNMSSLVYTQTSPGRGETGADISAIPTDMIKRVEILRDGASAQYGSDAIAGVMNIILKDDTGTGSVNFRTGVTGKGDGAMYGVSLNNGEKLGKEGFINYTLDMSKVEMANRPGVVDAEGEALDFGAAINDVKAFLVQYPDAKNINGSSQTVAIKGALNFGLPISTHSELYGNAAYVYKKVNSFANYRTPYWRSLSDYPYLANFFPNGSNGSYAGYLPTFDGGLNDYNATLGFKTTRNDWNTDLSLTTGGNRQDYTISNSFNRSNVDLGDVNNNGIIDTGEISIRNKYGENSPITFKPGGTIFNHIVGNIDINRRISNKVGIGFGSEFRTETFEILAGDRASYEGSGADSFAGNVPENTGNFSRYNIGGYLDVLIDFTENFLINGTVRYENYSDFGDAVVWKASSRYKFLDDKITLRGSISTGFRAPSLHQIFTQKSQYNFIPGSGILVSALVNNISREARLLGIPRLSPEKSTNYAVGLGLNPTKNLSITLDYYHIEVKDRIILSSKIRPTDEGNTALDKILVENNLVNLSFFTNGLNTRTQGVDYVANYSKLKIGKGNLNINLAGNITFQNERIGNLKNPVLIEQTHQQITDITQESLLFTSRPKYKTIFGLDYNIGKLGFSVNNTLFGPTKFNQDGLESTIYTEFKTKLVTDLGINWQVNKNSTLAANVNNVFNILPEWQFKAKNSVGESILKDPAQVKTQSNLITFNQRYSQMTYDGFHFSQLGTIFNLSYSFRF